jgi:hypothetical protein
MVVVDHMMVVLGHMMVVYHNHNFGHSYYYFHMDRFRMLIGNCCCRIVPFLGHLQM